MLPSGPFRATRLTLPNFSALLGKSSRKWPPRLSLRIRRLQGETGRAFHGIVANLAGGVFLGVLAGELAGAFAEDDQIGERVAAQPIGAVDADSAFAAGEQPRYPRHLCVGIDLDAA